MALFHTTVVDNQIKALSTIGSASGSIATFETDKAENLVNLEVAITATGGGGTPVSPIAINGFSACNLSVNGTTETIPFGQTVYGGRLNVGSGVLTITHGYFTVTGSDVGGASKEGDLWRISFYPQKYIVDSSYPQAISNRYQVFRSYIDVNANNNSLGLNNLNSGRQVLIRDDTFTDTQSIKDSFDNVPLEVVYELSTPTTIQLDSKQIESIIGTNNIYADCGDIIDLKFILTVGKAIS